MDEYVLAFKKKKRGGYQVTQNNNSSSSYLKKFITRFLLAIIFFLVSIIYTNLSDKNLLLYKEYVLEESLPFTKIKTWYEDLFGEVLPKNEPTQAVFNGKLLYKDITPYGEGEKLTVTSNTLINNLTSGIVVFIGEKDNYGHTVIVQGVDGTDIWYGNLTNVSINLYDYLEKDTVIGEVNGEDLYLVIKKNNETIKYEDYQNQ